MVEKSPAFLLQNFMVCHYCEHQAIGPPDYKQGLSPSGYACSLNIIKDEIFRPIGPFDAKVSEHAIDGKRGCERFEASGLPAHSSVVAKLVSYNPLAKNIPVDPNATETGSDFEEKMRQYPHVKMSIGGRK